MEALHSPNPKNPKFTQSQSQEYETCTDANSKNKIEKHTLSINLQPQKTDPHDIVFVNYLHDNNDNAFEDDIIITKEQPLTIFKFKPLTFKSREEIGPLVYINSIDPLSTQKFTNIGSPLIGAPKNVEHISGMDQNCLF